MALTYLDQFQIASNKKDFEGLVIIGATRVANDWLAGGNAYMTGEKVFDTTQTDPQTGAVTQINQEAGQYRNKLHNLCVKICNKDRNLYDPIQTMLAVIIADTMPDTTLEQLGGSLGDFIQQQEETFNAMMMKAFERVSGVSKKEKAAYEAL